MKCCTKCLKEKELFEFHKNGRGGLHSHCKSCKNKYSKQYRKIFNDCWDKKKRAEYNKQWRMNNKEHISAKQKEKRDSNTTYKLAGNCRTRIGCFIRQKGFSKNSSTRQMIGCNWKALKKHLELQFKKGMSWGNYGSDWHIDHVIPLVRSDRGFYSVEELCHFTNLQPLWANDNIVKGGS